MRAEAVDYRVSQSEQRTSQDDDTRTNGLTPARRAALDALERKLQELLRALPR
jgi:hypothetical protein